VEHRAKADSFESGILTPLSEMITFILKGKDHRKLQQTGELLSGAWQTLTAICKARLVDIVQEVVALPWYFSSL
jgi:hypothetical protein